MPDTLDRILRQTEGARARARLSFPTVPRATWNDPRCSTNYYGPWPDDLMRATIVYAYVWGLWYMGKCTMSDACDLASERDRSLGGTGCHRMADHIVSSIF